jgi:hypothetical protein
MTQIRSSRQTNLFTSDLQTERSRVALLETLRLVNAGSDPNEPTSTLSVTFEHLFKVLNYVSKSKYDGAKEEVCKLMSKLETLIQ